MKVLLLACAAFLAAAHPAGTAASGAVSYFPGRTSRMLKLRAGKVESLRDELLPERPRELPERRFSPVSRATAGRGAAGADRGARIGRRRRAAARRRGKGVILMRLFEPKRLERGRGTVSWGQLVPLGVQPRVCGWPFVDQLAQTTLSVSGTSILGRTLRVYEGDFRCGLVAPRESG